MALPRARREIPRTDFLADVASVGVLVQGVTIPGWNGSLELDGEVRKTARRIEDAWSHERTGRARVQASRARPALIERRGVRLEREAAENLGKKDPRTQVFIDQAGVLADPSKPRILRVHPFLYRARVDVGPRFEILAGDSSKTRHELT